jgi:hypothetical protein
MLNKINNDGERRCRSPFAVWLLRRLQRRETWNFYENKSWGEGVPTYAGLNDDERRQNVVRRLVVRWGVIVCAVVMIGCVVVVPLCGAIVSGNANGDDVGNVVAVRRSSTPGGDR